MGDLKSTETWKISWGWTGIENLTWANLLLLLTKLKIKKTTELESFLPRELAWEKEDSGFGYFLRGKCRGHVRDEEFISQVNARSGSLALLKLWHLQSSFLKSRLEIQLCKESMWPSLPRNVSEDDGFHCIILSKWARASIERASLSLS